MPRHRYTATIRALTPDAKTYLRHYGLDENDNLAVRVLAADEGEARQKAMRKVGAQFVRDSGLPRAYGQLGRPGYQRGTTELLGKIRVNVEPGW